MTLWLQVDLAGGVWAGETQNSRTQLCESISDFSCDKWNDYYSREATPKKSYVNICSVKQNAELLIKVFESLQELNLDGINLHRPPSRLHPAGLQTCSGISWAENSYPSSLGGARAFTHADLLTCKLQLQAHHKNDSPSWDGINDLIKLHPAWPAFSFLPFIRVKSAARLISMLGDPRWYINPKRSDSTQDLITAFGLAKDGVPNMEAASKMKIDDNSSRGLSHALVVLYSWCPVFLCDGEVRLCQIKDVSEEHRSKWVIKDYLDSPNQVDGLLIASRRFLRAVCNIWLDNLTPSRRYSPEQSGDNNNPIARKLLPATQYSPELFVPNYEFSDNTEELPRWLEHIANWRAECSHLCYKAEAHEGTDN